MSRLLIKSKGEKFHCFYDKADHNLISQFRWSLHNKGYAVTSVAGRMILMHRLILGIINNPEFEIDHKNHNPLDNRRANLRMCTRAENSQNSRKLKKSSSKFKGVYRDGNTWHTQIVSGQRVRNLGRFRSEITAAKVYDQEAREKFMDFAFVNFPEFIKSEQLVIPGM